ncbi:receptor-like protein EIX2 isoform X1 [Vicia villosa]|uniref:receptor-like protein EIX2 isoform X1 n=1 Tax=Vicia villosa TaxID=3911 RepID=UPI00273B2A01|nr:receptor-like protein EIX2 isoform X1 [Vicia villosa]
MLRFTSQIPIIWLLLLLLLSTTIFERGNSTQFANCNEMDRSALLNFKHAVDSPSSNRLSSWSINDKDCCSWKGVQCDNTTGRVTALDLHQQYLEGEINLHSLFQLQSLTYLDLSLNGFTTLSSFNQSGDYNHNLSNIQYLDLSFNDDLHLDNLNWLSKFSSLKSLNLSQINLQNQTNWFHTMDVLHVSLLELRLSSCHLTNIFPSTKHVSFTKSLVTLDLSANYFDSELPDWLFNLGSDSNISHIDLSFNMLQGQIPKSVLSLTKLEFLRLSNNVLNGSIPDWLGQHQNLKYLNLVENLFHGSIPSSLGNLSSLVDLSVGSDFLTGNIPSTIGKLFNLKSLFIRGHLLSGVLSEEHFSNLSNLETLVLSAPISFDIVSKWIPPFQLQGISLSSTNLGPKFPTWIYTQRSLEYLEFPNSRVSSIDGDTFWRFVSNITQLNLSYNDIDADLSNVTLNSEIIFMDNNNFRGGIPHISENVALLDLHQNSLVGTISPLFCHKIGKQNNLDYLDIHSNLLTGKIPDCWEYWKGISFLYLQSNMLTGELPPSMGSLIDLEILDLHDNNLSGNFSLFLSGLTNLEFINIGGNNFSGTLPVKMPHGMEVMILRSNQFEGNIPPQLCNISSLLQLDLSHNKLSGPIPKCINNIHGMGGAETTSHYPFEFNLYNKGQELAYRDYGLLRTLDLSANSLSGEIPTQVFSLVQLQILNLSRNHLTGKIAKEIGDMKHLESLDLSNNELNGEIPTTISTLSFLEFLNLSNNYLVGQIPVGTQLQSFDFSCYDGNPGLCGAPLPICYNESNQQGEHNDIDNENSFTQSLYFGMGVGFAVGFWSICGPLFLIRAWRHTYFRFISHVVSAWKHTYFRFISHVVGSSN